MRKIGKRHFNQRSLRSAMFVVTVETAQSCVLSGYVQQAGVCIFVKLETDWGKLRS